MKIWIDILTGKQLLFAEPIIRRLERDNNILCTTRNYRELNGLVKIRNIKSTRVGKHGGRENFSKLIFSTRRIEMLTKLIYKFCPDLAISFQSPEAARVAFGLGIRHIGFADSAHASAVMKLTIPYLDKLLIPWIMKKSKFSMYGIPKKDILQYKAIDAAIISKRDYTSKSKKDSKIIIIRMAEEQASYNEFANSKIIPIINQILRDLPKFQILVLARYVDQIKFLKKQFNNKIKVMQKVLDSKDILRHADVFIGSGGTMTAEAAFLGIPTISYSNRLDYEVDVFLERKKIIKRESDPIKITKIIKQFKKDSIKVKQIDRLLNSMEDPFLILQKAIIS